MPTKSIFVKNGKGKVKEYYYYGTYNTKKEAIQQARWYKKKKKSQYVITKTEAEGIVGFLYPHYRYALYLNKIIKLW